MIHGHLIDDELYVDNSLLSAVAKCDTHAYLRYAQDLVSPDESKYLKAGQAVHKALEAHAKGETTKAALAVLCAEYETWADANVPDDDRLTYDNVGRVLYRWLETHPLKEMPYDVEPSSIERSYRVPLTTGIWFTVKPDIGHVRMKATGQRMTVDHKTTGRISKEWSESFFDSSQVSGQIYATQHDETPATGTLINALELSKVPTSNRKCKDHGVPYSECADLHVKYELIGPIQRTPAQLAEWKYTAIELAIHYKQDLVPVPLNKLAVIPQQGKFTGACQYCAYKEFCRIGRPVEHVELMFNKEPWEPFKEEVNT